MVVCQCDGDAAATREPLALSDGCVVECRLQEAACRRDIRDGAVAGAPHGVARGGGLPLL